MAKIPKSGIANAQTIQASHITNIIEALDGTGSYDVVATGSFTGSFIGDGTGSFTGSFTGDGSGLTGVSDTNFANTSLTFDDNRAHDLNGFRVVFESASLNVFGISNTGVNVNAGQADRDFRVYTQGNTSTLFVEGSSDRVGVGKNTPNATLDVNGNAIITGSLILTGDVTASSYTGSFVGDGSGLDGVVATTLFALSEGSGVSAFTFDGTSTRTITISGSVGLTTDTITKWTGDAFADTSITDDGAVVDINSDTTITGSLTVDPTEIISATTRTIKETVTIDNTTAIVGSHPSSSNIYPGTRAFIDLSKSSTNQIFYELGAASEYQIGSQYEFIVTARSGSSNALRIDTQERLRARIHGADGTTQYNVGSFSSVNTGLDNAAVGDRITITKISQGAIPVWLVEAFVSGAAGYVVS
jgi:hypothetical protein